MNYDMSSYFEDPEFKEALARYEGMVENHTPAYFEADELTDIAEYYASKGRHKDADKAINLAIQLHPDNIDALIFRARSLMLHEYCLNALVGLPCDPARTFRVAALVHTSP